MQVIKQILDPAHRGPDSKQVFSNGGDLSKPGEKGPSAVPSAHGPLGIETAADPRVRSPANHPISGLQTRMVEWLQEA